MSSSTSKLSAALHKKRPISYLSNSKLSEHLSSSSDCLSGDEGYFGSYSDIKNLNHQFSKEPKLPPASISQQEQAVLLKYLLQNQYITQLNNLNESTVENSTSDKNNNIPESMHSGELPENNLDDNSDIKIPCLNIFSPVEEEDEAKYTNLLSDSVSEDIFCTNSSDTDKFDVNNLLTYSEKSFNKLNTGGYLEGLKLKEEIIEIITEQQLQRYEQERVEEIEMRTLNWRQLLDKRAKLEKLKREINEEDQIDGAAYLNEIEMNLDHFQSGEISSCNEASQNEDILIDTLLKFRTNRMAFNLRSYHRHIETELEKKRLHKENHEKNIKLNMFANVHVDSIPEFTPFVPKQDHFYEFGPSEQDQVDYEVEDYDQTYIDQHHGGDMVEMHQEMYEELGEHYHMLETDYTMVNEETDDMYDENGYLISGGGSGVLYNEEDLVDTADFVDSTDSEYLGYEEDYEDYEDRLMVDSLSEQDALNLLRNESEMYALQMAQASKSGLLPKSKSGRKKKGRFNSGNSSTTTQSMDTTSDSKLEAATSNVDIFENVFNFDEVIRNSTKTDSNSDLASSSASISGTTESENCTSENFDLEINEFLMPQLNEQQLTGNGNISMSLRNSLLKLRHTRRHLAKLIDSKKTASDSSSTSSSLTNSSGTPLGTQFTKQITISALSRKPCVYMLNEGRCMRADCRFAHDLKQITCKYWIDGECLKGENCEFLHEIIEEVPQSNQKLSNKKAQKAIAIKKKDFKLDTDDFPTLGGEPPQTIPKPTEFPPLGTSPISILSNNTTSGSPKEFPMLKKVSEVPAVAKIQPNPVSCYSKAAAATVLKTTAQTSYAVNLVQNKPQPKVSQTKPTVSNIQKQSKKPNESPCTPAKDNRKSRDQAKSQNFATKVVNSCGSSSISSSCSSSGGSRGNSIVRSNKK